MIPAVQKRNISVVDLLEGAQIILVHQYRAPPDYGAS